MAGGIGNMYSEFGGGEQRQQPPYGASRFSEGFARSSTPAGPVSPSNAMANQYKLYDSGVQTQAADYDRIMGGYQGVANSNITPQTFTPQTRQFTPSADSRSAIANMQDLSKTGGYTDQGIADLRARGVSPIRSIYSSAQNNINRQRNLQGGYSPNYTAATAKMARDESQQISDATQNVNAGLAQAIAGNKLAIAPSLASATGRESEMENQFGANAAGINNAGSQFNIENDLNSQKSNIGNKLSALEAMRSLYGTTPALAALFGNQALQTAGLVQNSVNDQTTAGTNLARLIASGMR